MSDLEEMERSAQDVGRLIGSMLPEDVGFVLVVSSLGEGGWQTFVSSQERSSTVRALRELIQALEEKEHHGPVAFAYVDESDLEELQESGASGASVEIHTRHPMAGDVRVEIWPV